MNRLKTTLTVLCLFSVFSSFAQEMYDLRRCLETGLDRNYEIRIVRNEQTISDNNTTIGNAGYLPSLDLNAGYSGTLNDIESVQRDGTTSKKTDVFNQNANAGLNLGWTIFDGFQMQTNYNRLKEFKQMGELNTRLTVENFVSKLTAEYYNYVHQNQRLAHLKYAVSLSKERLRIVEAHHNMGSKSQLDVQQARVDFNADSSRLIKQFETVYTSRIALNELMAVENVSQELITVDSIIAPNMLLEEQRLWEQTMICNTGLLLSEKNKTLGELDYKAIKSRDYPYLKFNTGYGYSANLYESGDLKRQGTLGLNYGLTLGFNLFDGMNRNREKKNAKIVIQNRELQHEQLELSLKADLSNIWMAYRNNLELINLEKENLKVAREYYEIAMDRYKLGDLAGIELREAQNSLLEAEERLLNAQYNTKLCEISLLQISGQITDYLE